MSVFGVTFRNFLFQKILNSDSLPQYLKKNILKICSYIYIREQYTLVGPTFTTAVLFLLLIKVNISCHSPVEDLITLAPKKIIGNQQFTYEFPNILQKQIPNP